MMFSGKNKFNRYQISEKVTFLPLNEAPFKPEDAFTIQFGNPSLKRQAVIFISLDCQDCIDFLKKMNEERELVRFDIVILPSPANQLNG